MRFNEDKFRAFVQPHILRCRDGDWNHANRVVSWVKKIGQGRKDISLLISTAYIHDVGWRDVLPKGRITFNKLLKYEERANLNSKPFAEDLLKKLGYATMDVIKINRLIKAADNHKSKAGDEAVIVDADNLSKLTINHLKEKYKKSEWDKMYNLWKVEFPNRIKTRKATIIYPKLLEELKRDIVRNS